MSYEEPCLDSQHYLETQLKPLFPGVGTGLRYERCLGLNLGLRDEIEFRPR